VRVFLCIFSGVVADQVWMLHRRKEEGLLGYSWYFSFPILLFPACLLAYLSCNRVEWKFSLKMVSVPPPALGESIQNITALGLFGSAAFYTFLKMPINPIKSESLIINDALCTRFYLWHQGELADVFQTVFVAFVEFLFGDRNATIHRKFSTSKTT
jgi:hypothetical protein